MSAEKEKGINVVGARVHNLKNIDVFIPHRSLTVITGLSGSGKSSLAFDTIFAEGQRRYIDTFSSYARGFIGNMQRPDVDKITGLSPVISIEQKTTNSNPRSTVGTTTEIYDYLRLLYARAGEAYSYVTGEKMVRYTDDQIVDLLVHDYDGERVYLLAPLVRNRKGHYRELFDTIRKKGYIYVRVDGELQEIVQGMRVDRYKNHSIEVVVDRLIVNGKDRKRMRDSMDRAMKQGNGIAMVMIDRKDNAETKIRYFSRSLMCPTTGISYNEPAPHSFSFNSPMGYCPTCKGLGYVNQIDMEKIVPNPDLNIEQGAIEPLGKKKNTVIFMQIGAILEQYDCTLKTPFKNLPQEAVDKIFNGTDEQLNLKDAPLGYSNFFVRYEGILKYLEQQQESDSMMAQKWAGQYSKKCVCPECNGARLCKESLHFRIGDKNIAQLSDMDIDDLLNYLKNIEPQLTEKQQKIGHEIIKEICTRLQFMLDVGLQYLSLSRSSQTLSGGESQRIALQHRLALNW